MAARRARRAARDGAAAAACDGKPIEPGLSCWPMRNGFHGGLTIELTEPVCRGELLRHLSIEPAPGRIEEILAPGLRAAVEADKDAGKGPCSRSFTVDGDMARRSEVSLSISAGLRDVFGQTLDRPYAARFRTRGLPPGLFLPLDAPGVREPWRPYRIRAVNVRQVSVRSVPLRGEAAVRTLACFARERERGEPGQCLPVEGGAERVLPLPGRADRTEELALPLPAGMSALRLHSPQVLDPDGKPVELRRLVTVTDLGLHARLTAYGLTAWVASLRTGRELRGVLVQVFDGKARLLASAVAASLSRWPRTGRGTSPATGPS